MLNDIDSSNAPADPKDDIVVTGVRGKTVSIGAKIFTATPTPACGICMASITNGADKGRIILTSEGSVPSLAKNSKGVPGWYSRNRDGTITFHPLTAMDYAIGGMVLVAPPIALELGAGAAFAEGGELTIGEILSGSHADTLIHLTPESAEAFSGGVEEGTFFARLGDVSHMTVPEYQSTVVMPAAAAGPGQSVNGFVLASPESAGAFGRAGVFNSAGVTEYTNGTIFTPKGYVPVP